jgi:hypothetical protein
VFLKPDNKKQYPLTYPTAVRTASVLKVRSVGIVAVANVTENEIAVVISAIAKFKSRLSGAPRSRSSNSDSLTSKIVISKIGTRRTAGRNCCRVLAIGSDGIDLQALIVETDAFTVPE